MGFLWNLFFMATVCYRVLLCATVCYRVTNWIPLQSAMVIVGTGTPTFAVRICRSMTDCGITSTTRGR